MAVADLASAGFARADAVQALILSLGKCVRCHVGRDHLVGAAKCVRVPQQLVDARRGLSLEIEQVARPSARRC